MGKGGGQWGVGKGSGGCAVMCEGGGEGGGSLMEYKGGEKFKETQRIPRSLIRGHTYGREGIKKAKCPQKESGSKGGG